MRPLKEVTRTHVKTIQSFASKALSKDEITEDAHDKIRATAQSLLEVVNEAVDLNVAAEKTREQKTVRQRRRHRNTDVSEQIALKHREAVAK